METELRENCRHHTNTIIEKIQAGQIQNTYVIQSIGGDMIVSKMYYD